MQLHREDFEIIKVIGRGAFGEVRDSLTLCMAQALLAPYFLGTCLPASSAELWMVTLINRSKKTKFIISELPSIFWGFKN